MARIYISSTSVDLEAHRKIVGEALRRLGHQDVAMDYYVAEDMRPLDRSLNDVAASDVYVGIFAYRYGHVPKEDNPEGRSITELEYRKAQEKGIPCLIFLLSDDAPWPKSKQEKGEGAQKIEILREELSSGGKHVVNFFKTEDELARQVNEAVINWATEQGLTPKHQLTNWDTYREAVSNRHQWIRLQVIAGASKERGPVRIPLTEVFESQLAMAGTSGADVPDEVRKYQEQIYGSRSEVPAVDDEDEPDEKPDSETQEALLMANPEQVLDLLGRERTQVILGGPGSGKSTILHYVMLRMCQIGAASEILPPHLRETPLPFLIDLRSYVLQKAPDFPTYIVRNSVNLYDAVIELETLTSVFLQKGNALVLFDGLDEVFDPDERRRVIDQFQSFAHRYPQARIIVTSRIAGYDRTALGLAGFEHYTLLPLTLGQIRHFAEQWYQYYTLEGTDRTAQGLVQRIIESPRLLDLAGNPLLLTMMAVIYKDRDLPNERWKLYERCAETLLEDWDVGKGIEDEDFKLLVPIRTAQKSEVLQHVSMYMLEHGQKGRELNAIAYAPLREIVASYLEEKYQLSRGEAEAVAVDILRHLMERTYVLAGIGERIFGFVHRTFMEYFAACYCKEQFNKRKSDFDWLNKEIFGAHWNEGEWEEVLLLLIAMLHDQKTPIREVIEHLRQKDRRKEPFRLTFAARCLGEAGDLQDPAQGKLVLEELAKAIEEFAKSKKEFAALALKAFASLAPLVTPPPTSVERIISDLEGSPFVANRMAAWQMGFAMRSRKERLAYARGALKNRDESVRRGAIAALEREWPGRADIGTTLTEVVRYDRQARVRQAALSAIQRSWRSEPAILDAIESRIDEETGHRNVIRLINYLATWRGNDKAMYLVMRLAGRLPKARETYDYDSVMAAALHALTYGWPGNLEILPFLKDQATTHPKSLLRSVALQSIAQGWPGKKGSLQFLQMRAKEDLDPQTRTAGLLAIGERWAGDLEVLSYLQNAAVTDQDAATRASVLQTIGNNWGGNAKVLRFLESRANAETQPNVRTAAFKAIASGWAGLPEPFSFLLKWVKNREDGEIRLAALDAIRLGWGKTEQGFNLIKDRAREDPDPVIRRAAIDFIGELITTSIYGGMEFARFPIHSKFLLERAVHDSDLAVRESVFAILANLNRWAPIYYGEESNMLDFFLDRVKHDLEPRIRLQALKAIVQTPYIVEGPATRKAVLNENLPFLTQQAASNPDAQVRKLAIEVMSFGGAAWNWAELLPFLKNVAATDSESVVRIAAIQTIGRKMNAEDDETLAFLELRVAEDPDLLTRANAQYWVQQMAISRGVKY